MVCLLSFKLEIATLMLCLYLLQGSPFYDSHEFAMISISHLLDTLKNTESIDASIVRFKDGNLAICSSTTDYVCRLDTLE
jgi:hypothetical protein